MVEARNQLKKQNKQTNKQDQAIHQNNILLEQKRTIFEQVFYTEGCQMRHTIINMM